jgi:hypothetical protein
MEDLVKKSRVEMNLKYKSFIKPIMEVVLGFVNSGIKSISLLMMQLGYKIAMNNKVWKLSESELYKGACSQTGLTYLMDEGDISFND